MYYVYILTNFNNRILYTGVTNNLERRIYEHKNGVLDGFTKKYQVHKLIYYECHSRIEDAIAREKKIKKLSRANKEKLIATTNPNCDELSDFISGDSLAPLGMTDSL